MGSAPHQGACADLHIEVAHGLVVDYVAPAPAVYASPAPVVEYIAPAQVMYLALAPAASALMYLAPAPALCAVPILRLQQVASVSLPIEFSVVHMHHVVGYIAPVKQCSRRACGASASEPMHRTFVQRQQAVAYSEEIFDSSSPVRRRLLASRSG